MFEENINQSLFNNNDNNNVESDMSIQNEDDVPPVLSEIKNLNESTNLVAPSKNALDAPFGAPQSYFSRDMNQDKLEQYENNGTSFNQPPEVAVAPYSSPREYNSEPQVPNTSVESSSYYGMPVSEEPTSGTLNTPVIDTSTQKLEDIVPEESYNQEVNPIMNASPILEPSSSILDTSVLNDAALASPKEDYKIVDDMSLNTEEEIKEPIENVESINDTLSQDQLEEDEMIEPEEEISDTSNFDNNKAEELTESNELDDIKNIVENMKNKGINVRVEEFDFETIHQMIIIIEK